MAVNALGFLDSVCITVFMSLCDIVGISDRLADHDSLSTQRNFQGKSFFWGIFGIMKKWTAVNNYRICSLSLSFVSMPLVFNFNNFS